jgi:hypothetical protein
MPELVRRAGRHGEQALRKPELQWLARSGFVARGLVYGVVGILSLSLALGVGGKTTSQQGALQAIARAPVGGLLLVLVAVGLAGYSFWKLLRGAAGLAGGRDAGVLRRVADLASGVAYAALAVAAVEILIGAGTGGSGSPKKAAAGVLGWPGGTLIVGAAGVIMVGAGLYQGYTAFARTFLKESDTTGMSAEFKRAFTALGIFGYLARMVIFALIGYGLIRAALHYSPHNAIGLDGALSELAHAAYGPVLLGAVAVGLTGFAAFSITEARYRKI